MHLLELITKLWWEIDNKSMSNGGKAPLQQSHTMSWIITSCKLHHGVPFSVILPSSIHSIIYQDHVQIGLGAGKTSGWNSRWEPCDPPSSITIWFFCYYNDNNMMMIIMMKYYGYWAKWISSVGWYLLCVREGTRCSIHLPTENYLPLYLHTHTPLCKQTFSVLQPLSSK